MARIAGVDLPKDKRIETALTYIYGIGPAMAKQILAVTKVDPGLRVKALAEGDIVKLRDMIERDHVVEGDLRREVTSNIKRLMEIGCYRGFRHRRKLPVRGQRTKTNARTRKGPHRMVIGAKAKKTSPAAPAKA
jgi:small subunit ribosomal protein S13